MKKHLALALAFIIMSVTACGGAAKGTGQVAEPVAETIQSEAPATEEAASPAEASPSETAAAETAQPEVNVSIPYWTEGSAVADSIVAYVKSVTDETSDSYVAPADRIAIFDFDGTLYGERYPTYFDTCLFIHRALHDESFTAPDDIREYAQAMEAALYNHLPEPDSDKSTAQCAAECFKEMTTEEYCEYVKKFMASPAFGFEGMTYAEGFYKPMSEVVKYLAENDFTIFISSGSERAMVRELIKGNLDEWIPSDRVIGSTFSLIASGQGTKAGRKYTISADDQILMEGNLVTKNQNTNKVFSIIDEIGKCPILVFGNSSGDLAMAQYVLQHGGKGYMLLCDDTERDYGDLAVAAKFADSCEKMGLETVSMKNDFSTIYGDNAVKVDQKLESEEQPAETLEQIEQPQEPDQTEQPAQPDQQEEEQQELAPAA